MGRMTPEAQTVPSDKTHGIAVACLGTHTKELRNGRGSMPVLRGPTSLCVCLWEFKNSRCPTK